MKTTTVTAQWTGPELQYEGTDTKGNLIKMGGDDISPAQMVLLGFAGCMGMDVISILKKKRQNVESINVSVTGHQPEEYPKPFKIVEITLNIKGENISEKAVERAIELSRDIYCIVGQTLKEPVQLQTSYKINALN